MTDNSDENSIARARRRARELGEECLSLAKLQADRLANILGRTPSFAEEVLLEQVAYLAVRIRMLRKWGMHGEADKATRLLATVLKVFERDSRSTVAKLLDDKTQKASARPVTV